MTTSLQKHDVRGEQILKIASSSITARPQVELDEKTGTFRINDTRLIAKDRRAFCRQLVHAMSKRSGVKKTVIDLASASCRVQFIGPVELAAMAGSFAEAVREASAAACDGDGTPWWQASTNWVALTAYADHRGVSLWETADVRPGRIRIRHRSLVGDFERLSKVANAIARLGNVEMCKAIPWSHRLTIDFLPENGAADWFIDEAERCLKDVLDSEAPPLPPMMLSGQSQTSGGPIDLAPALKRPLFFALGLGGLVMTVVGIIVPGIPTVPFLLVASYGFARSSPRAYHWLRESPFLGAIVTEWEHHGGLSQMSKRKLIGLTVVIILIAVLLAPLSPVSLALMLVMASLSAYGVYHLPSAPEEPPASLHDAQATHLIASIH